MGINRINEPQENNFFGNLVATILTGKIGLQELGILNKPANVKGVDTLAPAGQAPGSVGLLDMVKATNTLSQPNAPMNDSLSALGKVSDYLKGQPTQAPPMAADQVNKSPVAPASPKSPMQVKPKVSAPLAPKAAPTPAAPAWRVPQPSPTPNSPSAMGRRSASLESDFDSKIAAGLNVVNNNPDISPELRAQAGQALTIAKYKRKGAI